MQTHAYLFGGLFGFAGQIRTKPIWKDGTLFLSRLIMRTFLREINAKSSEITTPRLRPRQKKNDFFGFALDYS